MSPQGDPFSDPVPTAVQQSIGQAQSVSDDICSFVDELMADIYSRLSQRSDNVTNVQSALSGATSAKLAGTAGQVATVQQGITAQLQGSLAGQAKGLTQSAIQATPLGQPGIDDPCYTKYPGMTVEITGVSGKPIYGYPPGQTQSQKMYEDRPVCQVPASDIPTSHTATTQESTSGLHTTGNTTQGQSSASVAVSSDHTTPSSRIVHDHVDSTGDHRTDTVPITVERTECPPPQVIERECQPCPHCGLRPSDTPLSPTASLPSSHRMPDEVWVNSDGSWTQVYKGYVPPEIKQDIAAFVPRIAKEWRDDEQGVG